MAQKKDRTAINLLIGVVLIAIIGILIFLFTPGDRIGSYEPITGLQAIQLQNNSFWFWVILGTIFAVASAYAAYVNETGEGWFPLKLPGTDFVTIVFVVMALFFIVSPWPKVFTDKANAGVTAPKFKNEQLK
jgi:hypothetical protein